jgi:CrcB protein
VRTLIGIGVAGAAGSLARYGVDGLVAKRTAGAFPWGTLAVNVTGAFLVGLLFTVLTERFTVAPWLRSSLLIGLLGGYTTFSTFTLESYRLVEDGAWALGMANLCVSVVGGMLAVYLGVVAGRALS